MPNVVLEALACGCPVVATDVGEVPRLIEEGINGYTVATTGQSEKQIIEALAEALRKALSHEWDHHQIAQNMSSYTWPAAAQVVSQAILN
jgi:glycosyltransferase involved in cell wall biosynthesis